MKTKLTILTLILTASFARADLIQVGQISFTGDFTLNHLYDFNNPGAQPFGSFSLQTVTGATGIFAPFVHVGDTLSGQALWTETNLPLFSLDGYDFMSNFVNISGADSGRLVLGIVNLTGNGYVSNPDKTVNWMFTAPPYDISNFPTDITGPITLTFNALFDNHHVPDNGSTLILLSIAILTLSLYERRIHRNNKS